MSLLLLLLLSLLWWRCCCCCSSCCCCCCRCSALVVMAVAAQSEPDAPALVALGDGGRRILFRWRGAHQVLLASDKSSLRLSEGVASPHRRTQATLSRTPVASTYSSYFITNQSSFKLLSNRWEARSSYLITNQSSFKLLSNRWEARSSSKPRCAAARRRLPPSRLQMSGALSRSTPMRCHVDSRSHVPRGRPIS